MSEEKVSSSVAHSDKPNSCAFFKPHWICWKMLGIKFPSDSEPRHKRFYLLYSILLNVAVTVCYPLHLALQLFRSNSMADNIKNMAVCITCVACSTKFIIYAVKLPTIRAFEQILESLDERISDEVETFHFEQMGKRLRRIRFLFMSIYFPVGLTAELSFVFRDERKLLYPGWFPFNWLESNGLFVLANVYQFVGISVLVLQNFVDDAFPAMALCVLSGHTKILSIRLSNLGHDNKTLEENELELKRCVEDQQKLHELYGVINSIISWPIFLQFCISATNICLAISALFFFVSAPLDILYYLVYYLAMELQIFSTCYYGSDTEYQFNQLHRSIYASNWTEQTLKYKKHMILFTERSLKENVALAGGMVRINLDTFFATCRGAYSLMAVITTMK